MKKIGELIRSRKRTVLKPRERIRDMTREEFVSLFNSRLAPDPSTGCLVWHKRHRTTRYGTCWNPLKHKQATAHRTAMELHIGRFLTPDENVLHKCDNGFCCNPDHLFIGTHQENMDDMNRKGRAIILKGERNGNAKLTEAQVIEIRSKYIPRKYGTPRLAKEYGVTQGLTMAIISNRIWKHLPPTQHRVNAHGRNRITL